MNKSVIPAKAGIHVWHYTRWLAWIPAYAGMTLLCLSAFALVLEEPMPNPAQEAQARAIFSELRCVVCQGESIADSSAQIAVDMRREIRAQIAAGKKQPEIVSYFTQRYGDYVLMRPPLSNRTALLWFAPLLLILVGGIVIFRYFRTAGAKK